jgi:hypothetical protein
MSEATITTPLTARDFLYGTEARADTANSLGQTLSRHGVARSALRGVRNLSTSALHAVDGEIGTVAQGLIDLDLGDVLVAGWRKYSALTNAAERTLAMPGSEEVVVLATHRVTSTHRPSVDLLVDGAKVNTFDFELKIVFDVVGLVAVVTSGDLVALRGGSCVITATLAIEGAQLGQRQAQGDLALMVQLHPPVPLLDTAAAARVTSQTRGQQPSPQPRTAGPDGA